MRVYDTFPNLRKVCQMQLLLFFGRGYFSMAGGSRFMWKQKMVEKGEQGIFFLSLVSQ